MVLLSDLERQLGFQLLDTFVLTGTFHPPEVEYVSRYADERQLAGPGHGVADNYLVDDEITFFLPRGKALRWKLDPRILVFRGIPRPRAAVGAVFEILDNRWVIDSRAPAASLVLELKPMVELAVVGNHGVVHLYHVLRSEPRKVSDTASPTSN
jgi:hypothetical protein